MSGPADVTARAFKFIIFVLMTNSVGVCMTLQVLIRYRSLRLSSVQGLSVFFQYKVLLFLCVLVYILIQVS